MHRFYLPPEECRADVLTLTEREAHHAARVIRVRRGEPAVVLDGAGKTFHCEVAETSRDAVTMTIKRVEESPAPACAVTLVQAIPKGKILDSIIQKATELGARRVIPLLSERVITQIDEDNAESKTGHWRTVAVEAIKQCGSPWLPIIEPAIAPGELLARREAFELWIVASLQPGSRHPGEWFREFREREHRNPESACVWIGPEGDFTSEEITRVIEAGAKPITLGRLVLRCETAATYCLSILNYETQSREA